ncbi:SMI1/KNR4 family protein [Streptomyces sp. NPDC096132]|uniref:SMI1/KNR4 family protein n=1 Tax=Streptomyces sp. NPDC096132 TaxID=3366075 RepID=UPI003814E7C4
MAWVERLAAAVSWRSQDLEILWDDIEQRLGVELPGDFKAFCQCFGQGQFSGYLEVYSSSGGDSLVAFDKLRRFGGMAEQHAVVRHIYEPYGLFRSGGQGLLPWGISVTAAEYYWLASADGRPDDWPVVAREDGGEWKIYQMPMSEFVYRVLVDVSMEDFGIADLVHVPFYQPDS